MAKSAKHASTTSPVGTSTRDSARRRARSNAAYRAEQQRLEPYEELARIVIEHRTRLELTQKELADRMKTSHSAISRIESGQYPTKPDTLRRLAEALGLRFVMGFQDDSKSKATTQLITM